MSKPGHLSELWILDTGPGVPAWNMAVDEALLSGAVGNGAAVLRFYGWTEAAATFGYFQRLAEVELRTGLRPLIRRPTGGGIVPHAADWTYSLAVPPGHGWHGLRATESYRAVHAWVVESFARLGVSTELAACCRKEIPGQCFVGYEQFDVLWGGRKIAGAAQRRNRLGLLIQGSVQPPPAVERHRAAWQAAMAETAPDGFFGRVVSVPVLPEVVARQAEELAAAKYSRSDYNGGR